MCVCELNVGVCVCVCVWVHDIFQLESIDNEDGNNRPTKRIKRGEKKLYHLNYLDPSNAINERNRPTKTTIVAVVVLESNTCANQPHYNTSN